ncbi:MAG: hypothetical protein V1682_02305 [Candidatus Omnitrophota bacterium]
MKKTFIILTLVTLCAAAIIAIRDFQRNQDTDVKAADRIAPKPEKIVVKVTPEPKKVPDRIMSGSETELRSSMRTLWELRAVLLRSYIVSSINDYKDVDEARDKLLKNAGDLGASIKPYHGYFAGGMLAGFLKKDVSLTAKIIKTAKAGNERDIEWAKKGWYANAFGLAGFFAITRNQTMEYLTNMLYKHLDLTWGEIQSMLKKDKAKDLEYYEKDRAHMIMLSDVLTDGLVKQFPKRFIE